MASPTSDRGGQSKAGRANTTLEQESHHAIRRRFEDLGLTGYEASLLVALLNSTAGTVKELSRAAGISYPNAYPALERLGALHLAEPLPGNVARWACPGRDTVIDRLLAIHEARLQAARRHGEEVRQLLAEHLPESSAPALPFVHLISDTAETSRIYRQLMAQSQFEVLTFTKLPHLAGARVGEVSPTLIGTLARQVVVRTIFDTTMVEGPEAIAYREEIKAYCEAGLRARVADDVPLKAVVVDRNTALVGMSPRTADASVPASMLIQNAGFSAMVAASFEHFWVTGRDTDLDARPRGWHRGGTTGGGQRRRHRAQHGKPWRHPQDQGHPWPGLFPDRLTPRSAWCKYPRQPRRHRFRFRILSVQRCDNSPRAARHH